MGNSARPIGDFGSPADFQYQALRCNVSMSKVLQVSFSLFDDDGKQPADAPHTFTFNFQFSQL